MVKQIADLAVPRSVQCFPRLTWKTLQISGVRWLEGGSGSFELAVELVEGGGYVGGSGAEGMDGG